MTRSLIAGLGLLTLAAIPHFAMAQDGTDDFIKKGAYIARAADCMACHTNPGGKDYGGGYVISSPLGDIIASNISPSKTYGIGNWSEGQFAKAVREGVAPEGNLYPAMPYTAYSGISDADIHALYVYFMKGTKPVDEAPVKKTNLPFPFSQRWLMAGWNVLYASGKPMPAATTQEGGAKRGEYLVNVLAHCSTCHTPRNIAMSEDQSRFLGGADLGGWHAPNITSDPVSGIGGWSDEDIKSYLRDGSAHGKSQAAGGMAEAVEHSLRHLTDSDLTSIVEYLRTVKPVRDPNQKAPGFSFSTPKLADLAKLDAPIDRSPDAMTLGTSTNGAELYTGACASCHQLNGQGTHDQFYPSLTSNTIVGGPTSQNLVMAILKGVDRATNNGTVAMPAFEGQLNNEQVAAVANYVLSRFGNDALHVSASDVELLKRGGPKPFIARYAHSMSVAGIAAAGLFVLIIIFLLARRKVATR